MQNMNVKNRISLVETAETKTVSSRTAALFSIWSAALFLALLVALHFLKPEYQPSWRFVSEYAIGEYGWIMMVAFLFLALSCGALFVVIRSEVSTRGGKIGSILLMIVAASLIVAGVFVADPITAKNDELTTHGFIHGLAAMVGIPGLPIAAVLISRSLARTKAWMFSRRMLLWTAHLTWFSVALMFVSMFLMLSRSNGKFSPDVLIGWPNRFVVLAYCVWVITVAWNANRLSRLESQHISEYGGLETQ